MTWKNLLIQIEEEIIIITRAVRALYLWQAIYLVEVAQKIIPATRRYHAHMGGWLLRHEVNTESSRSDDTTNIIAISRVPGNPEWTDDPCVIANFYGKYQSK